jgi:cullin-associated NEDD8-dissociated protein 1
VWLPQLRQVLESAGGAAAGAARIRGTAVHAVRHVVNAEGHIADAALREHLPTFLQAIGDGDNDVRHIALNTFNAVVHHKLSLVVEVLDDVMALVYRETDVRPELIREVEMGPFKHKIDAGLDTRKAAFECMFTVLDACPGRLSVALFLKNVLKGLRDHYDVQMLMYLMLSRVAEKNPIDIAPNLDDFAEALLATIDAPVQKNAVKQELEQQEELKRTAVRAVCALHTVPGSGEGGWGGVEWG